MRRLTWDEFANTEGAIYEVELDGGRRVAMTLDRATELPSGGREGGSFRLEFLGPADPLLPQSIYPFHRGDDRCDIFVVPIGQDEQGTRYEAIFY